MNTPTTYAKARSQARGITWDEFADIIATDDNPYVYPRPYALRRIAMNVRLHRLPNCTPFASYEFCNNKGYGDIGSGGQSSVWHFDSVGTVSIRS